MVFRNLFKAGFALASACALAQPSALPQNRVVNVDRVVAVVNDEAITQYELDDAKRIVLQQLKQQNVQPPAQDVLDKQVLERMMTERRRGRSVNINIPHTTECGRFAHCERQLIA